MKKIQWDALISTCFGLGFISRMPGTVASFAAVVFALIIPVSPVLILVTAAFGVFASGIYTRSSGSEDPGEVVIDEVVGTWIALYGHPPAMFVPAFGLFRILDIVKPFPVRNLEKLPGGIGIMADDIAAGLLSNLILRMTCWLLFSGGLAGIFG
ncbi:MAG: phosphatidylglycerophosphatase A [Thermovirga sp.]